MQCAPGIRPIAGAARWAPLSLAALGLVLCGPATAQAQQDDAAPAAADQAETDPQTSPPTLDVTVDVTATLPEVDRLIAAEGQRVGAAEGAQLISADYMKAQQASTLADALRKTTSVQVDEEGGQQGSLVFIRGLSQDQVSVRVEGGWPQRGANSARREEQNDAVAGSSRHRARRGWVSRVLAGVSRSAHRRKTQTEALERVKDALILHLESMLAHNEPLPLGPHCVVDNADD